MSNFQSLTPTQLLGHLNEVESKNAPEMLYLIGDLSILEEGARVSVVGSRKASPEGLARARKFAQFMAENGIVVVSGLAEGIDTAAHEAVIEKRGRTIAVIGTPLNKTFPAKNRTLQARIGREHLLVSQFPIGYPTQPKNFPIRNRTMALLSDATVIIEASDSSGSLSQGWEALRLGRELYIANSVVEDERLTWPAKMIHYGARILTEESLDEFFELPLRTKAMSDEVVPF